MIKTARMLSDNGRFGSRSSTSVVTRRWPATAAASQNQKLESVPKTIQLQQRGNTYLLVLRFWPLFPKTTTKTNSGSGVPGLNKHTL